MPVSAHAAPTQKDWVDKVQQRLNVTLTMLGNMKAVRMLGLTNVLYTLVSNLQRDELNTSKTFRKLLIWTVTLCRGTTVKC
jgi:hypothetical protein